MNCLCNIYPLLGATTGCQCDQQQQAFPRLHIPAGLSHLPRQLATFPAFRIAMLNDLKRYDALTHWKARQQDDFGLMLLEMWAYLCDSLSFYDEVIAHETYLRTARLRPSTRKLVERIGYLPQPAVAARVWLAAFAEGRKPVSLPLGTAFRSGAFDGEPPQVFELDQTTAIHPFTNRWNIIAPHAGIVGRTHPTDLLVEPLAAISDGSLLLLTDSNNIQQNQALLIKKVETHIGADENIYTKIILKNPTKLAANTKLSALKLWSPQQTSGLKTSGQVKKRSITSSQTIGTIQTAQTAAPLLELLEETSPQLQEQANFETPAAISNASLANPSSSTLVSIEHSGTPTTTKLTLNGLYPQLQPGSLVLVARHQEYRWFRVTQVHELQVSSGVGSDITINGSSFATPSVTTPVTQIVLDTHLNNSHRKISHSNWSNPQRHELTVHFNMIVAGNVVDEAKVILSSTDKLQLNRPVEAPLNDYRPGTFLLKDKNERGVQITGSVDFNHRLLNVNDTWNPPLHLPVEVYANVIAASRGEQVDAEILGSGNASLPHQTFQLKKKPLTYLPAPSNQSSQGLSNTLQVFVNDIRWTEVPHLYGHGDQEQIYIVRQDDEGETFVIFGDGKKGERLPTGVDNIVASYRFGAGAAAPPAGSISQIAKPVEGLQSVKNVLPAFGGADAESRENMRTFAPKSALLLGRTISVRDMEAAAIAVAGVRVVQAAWQWHGIKQQTLIHLWFIGETGVEKDISARLRSLSDPSLLFQVEIATAIPIELSLDLKIAPNFQADKVLNEVREALLGENTGLLLPENLGIGQALFRSQIFASVLSVAGVVAVNSITWQSKGSAQPFKGYAQSPGTGRWFDFEDEGLLKLSVS